MGINQVENYQAYGGQVWLHGKSKASQETGRNADCKSKTSQETQDMPTIC